MGRQGDPPLGAEAPVTSPSAKKVLDAIAFPVPVLLKTVLKRHQMELAKLRAMCAHPPEYIKLYFDKSVVGAGSCYPSAHLTCRLCGSLKIIFFQNTAEYSTKIHLTLGKQGFKDERLGLHTDRDYDLE